MSSQFFFKVPSLRWRKAMNQVELSGNIQLENGTPSAIAEPFFTFHSLFY